MLLPIAAHRRFSAAIMAVAMISGCSPELRDDYMGREWMQGERTLPQVQRDDQGRPLDDDRSNEEIGEPVPRDEMGNPILR